MRNLDEALSVYAESHQNPLNERIHYVCVPAILASTLGMLWCVPIGRFVMAPGALAETLNLGLLSALFCVAFYARLSPRACLYMLPQLALALAFSAWLSAIGAPLFAICASVWGAAWLAQFYGHKVEGKKPSFADDLAFLLIGPLFVLERVAHVALSPGERSATH